jgi:DNA-binding MarR family transcriptional regulator
MAQSDAESRLRDDHHQTLRLWLRLLTCTALVEQSVRALLRDRFDITLPRFDLMAQLERSPKGLQMGELSRRMMVTGGNVTGITNQLVSEGLVERQQQSRDRRACTVRLTRKGRRAFNLMASEHERWIEEIMGGLSQHDQANLHSLLGRLKSSVRARTSTAKEESK